LDLVLLLKTDWGKLLMSEMNIGARDAATLRLPKAQDLDLFHDESDLGRTTNHQELIEFASNTKSARLRTVATFVDQNSSIIEDLSPKGDPGILHKSDLELLRELNRIKSAADNAPFVRQHFGAIDANDNGKISERELKRFGDKHKSLQGKVDNVLDGFSIIAGASGKKTGSIDVTDLDAIGNKDTVSAMMREEYRAIEFGRRSAPISYTAGGLLAVLACMGDGTQQEKQRAVQGAFRAGYALGKLVSYPFLNNSIENYYESNARPAINKLFG